MSATPYACTSAFTICQGVTSTSSPSHVKQGEEEVGSSRVTGLGRSRRLFQIHAARARGRTRTQTLSHILWQVVCVWVCVCSVAQLCLTLCDPMVCSLRGSSMHGISQARILEWVAISFSNARKWKVKVKSLSRIWLFATPWTAAHQAPLTVGFPRQEYWSGLLCPPPGNLPDLQTEPKSPVAPALQAREAYKGVKLIRQQ